MTTPISLPEKGARAVASPAIPYGRHMIDDSDIAAVTEVLRGNWLTTGPRVADFEQAVASYVGAREAVAVSSGTAALHAAMFALEIGPGDEVIVPTLTFAASANCVVYQGGVPVFADVLPDTLLLDPASVEARITSRTRAIIAVDYTGHPCDYNALHELAKRHGIPLVADACHSLGAAYHGRAVGSLAALNTFSFHPVKPIATGEGGMITTDDSRLAQRMRLFRNHGITTDHRQREQTGSWFYEMVDLGFNYRLSDINCALGLNQLRKLPGWLERRRQIAHRYDHSLTTVPGVRPLAVRAEAAHAYHLYVVQIDPVLAGQNRNRLFSGLRTRGIGVNVHYVPVHLHPFYRQRLGTMPGLCPVAEIASERVLSLPMFPGLTDGQVDFVVETIRELLGENREIAAA